jgi:uncharacterized protein YciW
VPNLETPKTPEAFVETMLRNAIEGDRLADEHINDRDLLDAHTHTTVNAYIAAAAMHTLQNVAPGKATALARGLAQILDAGDLAGPAYRAAKELGHDPDQWIADHQERAARRKAKTP